MNLNMRKNFTSFLLFAFAVLLANVCFATSDNKKRDISFNASSDSMYAIEPSSVKVNERDNKPANAYSDSHLWIKNQLGEEYYHHYLQIAAAKKNIFSNKKNLKLDYFLNSYRANKTPLDETGQGGSTVNNNAVNDFTYSSITTPSQIESNSSPLAANPISTDNDLKEYIDQEISSDDLVNPISTGEEDSVFDAINLDDDHLRLLAKSLIGLLALLAIYAIFKRIMQKL